MTRLLAAGGLLALVLALVLNPIADVGASRAGPRPVVLLGGAVDNVHLGTPERTAAAALQRLLGPSEHGAVSIKGAMCTVDAVITWPDFTAYFLHGAFVGYQTTQLPGSKPARAFEVETDRGLRVGDTLAAADRLYPGKVSTSSENGGVFALRTAHGTIRGYLAGGGRTAAAERIGTLSAGSVGCPADSPG